MIESITDCIFLSKSAYLTCFLLIIFCDSYMFNNAQNQSPHNTMFLTSCGEVFTSEDRRSRHHANGGNIIRWMILFILF